MWTYAYYLAFPSLLLSIYNMLVLFFRTRSRWKDYYGNCGLFYNLMLRNGGQGKAYFCCALMSIADIICLFIRNDPSMRDTFPSVGNDQNLSFLNGISMSCWHITIPCIMYALIDLSMKRITRSQMKLLPKEMLEGEDETELRQFGITVLITSTLQNDALARKRRRQRARRRGEHLSLIDAAARYTCLLRLDKKIGILRLLFEIAIILISFILFVLSVLYEYRSSFIYSVFTVSRSFALIGTWAIFHLMLSYRVPNIRREFAKSVSQPPDMTPKPKEGASTMIKSCCSGEWRLIQTNCG